MPTHTGATAFISLTVVIPESATRDRDFSDVGSVFGDRAVGREPADPGNIQGGSAASPSGCIYRFSTSSCAALDEAKSAAVMDGIETWRIGSAMRQTGRAS
jgi:hypothetical protein